MKLYKLSTTKKNKKQKKTKTKNRKTPSFRLHSNSQIDIITSPREIGSGPPSSGPPGSPGGTVMMGPGGPGGPWSPGGPWTPWGPSGPSAPYSHKNGCIKTDK